MNLKDAIAKAFKENLHVRRRKWGDKSVSPAFLQGILDGRYEGVEITEDDQSWEVVSIQKQTSSAVD